jgi:hypothetical protein
LKGYKFPDVEVIPGLFQAGRRLLHTEAHKLVVAILNVEELSQQWNQYLIVLVYKIDQRSNYAYCNE